MLFINFKQGGPGGVPPGGRQVTSGCNSQDGYTVTNMLHIPHISALLFKSNIVMPEIFIWEETVAVTQREYFNLNACSRIDSYDFER